MRTSQIWWQETKNSPEKLADWLQKQFHGEAIAAPRIRALSQKYAQKDLEATRLLNIIADQEETHASWIAELCQRRGITPQILEKEERYWQETLPAIESLGSLEYASGVAAHAEVMRLERIKTIAADFTAPEDIRETFARILPQEEFHATTFERLATKEGMRASENNHKKGLNALGLIT